MPRKKRIPFVRKLANQLTMGQAQELQWACFAEPRNFESENDRRRGWEQHRAELMARTRPGSRPSAYWRYDLGEHPAIVREGRIMAGSRDGYPVKVLEHETETLIRLGLANAADLAELAREVTFCERDPDLARYTAEDLARMRAALASAGVAQP